MIDSKKLETKIIDVLHRLGMYSEDAVNLLMGTASQESAFKWVRQIGGGPALGYFQMEPDTFKDICNNFLKYKSNELVCKIYDITGIKKFDPDDLAWNIELMICFARLHYYRIKEPLPNTIEGYAKYWKKHYNTPLGAGTEEEFIKSYKRIA